MNVRPVVQPHFEPVVLHYDGAGERRILWTCLSGGHGKLDQVLHTDAGDRSLDVCVLGEALPCAGAEGELGRALASVLAQNGRQCSQVTHRIAGRSVGRPRRADGEEVRGLRLKVQGVQFDSRVIEQMQFAGLQDLRGHEFDSAIDLVAQLPENAERLDDRGRLEYRVFERNHARLTLQEVERRDRSFLVEQRRAKALVGEFSVGVLARAGGKVLNYDSDFFRVALYVDLDLFRVVDLARTGVELARQVHRRRSFIRVRLDHPSGG